MRVSNNRGRLRVARKKQDINPMDGLGNMADCMLVFALGILLALIISWNVDLSEEGEIGQSFDTKYEVEGVEDGQTEEIGDENLQEMGKVYKDPETGKYYVVEE